MRDTVVSRQNADDDDFVAELRQRGRESSTAELKRALGWDEQRFDTCVQNLIASGRIKLAPIGFGVSLKDE